MDDATTEPQPAGERLTRRGLLVAGGTAAAALWLGPEWSVIDGVASAATQNAALRRSGWLQVSEPSLRAIVDGRPTVLRLVETGDLPIAEQIPALHHHDAAFVVRLTGPAGLTSGTWGFDHPELGAFSLFVSPVDRAEGGQQLYEAVIDRTVLVAGIADDPAPVGAGAAATPTSLPDRVEVPAVRAQLLAPTVPMVGAIPPAVVHATRTRRAPRRRKPKPRRVAVTRSASRRTAVAEITWAHAGYVTSVHGLLVARGRVVARAGGRVRRLSRLRMRLKARRGIPRGRYELRLTVVERGGTVTRIHRTVRIR